MIILLVAVFVLALSDRLEAHPGRTDANGGHYCRTNCDSWGVPWNQWHSHGGVTPPAPAPAPAPTPKPPPPPPPPPPEPPKPKSIEKLRTLLNEKGHVKGVLWADLVLETLRGKRTATEFKRLDSLAIAKQQALAAPATDKKQGSQTFYLITEVIDGDTIRANVNGKTEKIRLLAIDTPETKDPRKPVQCFGQQATSFMTSLVKGKFVRLEPDKGQPDRDKYGRLLRYAYLESGLNVNAEMVKQGYAFAYTRFPTSQLDQMRELERTARENNRGLWNSCQ